LEVKCGIFSQHNRVAVGNLFQDIWLFLFTCHDVYVEVEVFVLGCGAMYMGWMSVRTEGLVTAFGPDTHPSRLHLTSNQQQLENQTAYVVTNAVVVSS